MTDRVTDAKAAGDRIFKNIPAWAPPVPAPIDIKSVNWATERYHANWDGNQGASSRTLASGASATGDPRMVNVRIHEPLNPFIDNLPPPPYPFASVDLARAREGKALFKTNCATCHTPRNQTIYPASTLGVDPNRTMVNTSVSRYGLAALVMEACSIYGLNNQGQPGADWCMPKGDWQARLDEYFRDTPRRVAEGTNGYKADMLRGIWAQAPYLHNGSVPTLGQLVCPATRPRRFLRGNLYYDEALVGFEWSDRPKVRYGPNDTILIKEYDTTVPGKANTGHTFGADLCPDTTGLDPVADRKEIETRLLGSKVGALLAYLKTLDRDGRLVTTLSQNDFEVRDEGKPQPITLVRQHSPTHPPDRDAGRVGQHGGQPAVAARWRGTALRAPSARTMSRGSARSGQDYDQSLVHARCRDVTVGSCRTRLHPMRLRRSGARSTRRWAPSVTRRTKARRVVLVLSDGKDSGPISFRERYVSQGEVIDRARHDDVMVYGIGMRSRGSRPIQPGIGPGGLQAALTADLPDPGLALVAEQTGGGYAEIRFGQDLGAAFAHIADELHSQYLLGFAPPKRDGKVHDIDVRVATRGLKPRARKSYVAPKEQTRYFPQIFL